MFIPYNSDQPGKRSLLRFSLFSYFHKPCEINRLQTKKDSIPIAVSPHPPQPPAATLNRPEKMTQLLMDQSELSVRPATEISLANRSALPGTKPSVSQLAEYEHDADHSDPRGVERDEWVLTP